MWSSSASGSVSEGYIEEWAKTKCAYSNGIADGRDAKENDISEANSNEWEHQLKESLEGELRQIQSSFSREDTFLAKEFKNRFNDFEETLMVYEKNKCGSSGLEGTNDIPMKPGIYKILMSSFVVMMWLVQILPFSTQIPTLHSFFFAGLVSIALSVAGHIIGRLFRRANKKNEKQVLGMVILTVILLLLTGLYGYLWWKSVSAKETFLIIGSGAVTLFMLVGMIYASYMSGDSDPLCTELKKRLDELKNDLDNIHITRKGNERDKQCSIGKFVDKAQGLIQEYRRAYKQESGRKNNWQDFPNMGTEFICKINDPYFDKWESRSQNTTA